MPSTSKKASLSDALHVRVFGFHAVPDEPSAGVVRVRCSNV